MKKRFYIAAGLWLLQVITLIFVAIFAKMDQKQALLLIYFINTFYLVLFFIGGLSKLLIYMIYGLIIFLCMHYFPDYIFVFVVSGTFLLLLNPLYYFENLLAKYIDKQDPIEFQRLVSKSYFPYYDYRAKMKEYYHLPQAKKMHESKAYRWSINIVTISLFALGIFLGLNELKNIGLDLTKFRLEAWLVFYVVIVIFITALLLYKKGYRSSFRFLSTVIFIPTIYLVFIPENLSIGFKIASSILLALINISLIAINIIWYFRRVVYVESKYVDIETQSLVYANSLYEPYLYNDSYTYVGIYKLDIDLETFQNSFKKLLIKANLKLFFITAYVYKDDTVTIYTQFHYGRKKEALRFKKYLDKVYNTNVAYELVEDVNHEIYEKNFYQKDDYIIARALSYAKLLKKLDLKGNIFYKIYFYFNEEDDLNTFNQFEPIRQCEMNINKLTGVVEFQIENTEYIIDLKMREILLAALMSDANYIKLDAGWKGDIK